MKLRLPDAAAHAALAAALRSGYRCTHDQENYFFDGPQQELSCKRVVLRVRFYDGEKKAVITVKGKQVGWVGGVSGWWPPTAGLVNFQYGMLKGAQLARGR